MIAGAGFARMAWATSWSRVYPSYPKSLWGVPFSRDLANDECGNHVSAEYYRIIDSAAASWPAFAGERQFMTPKVGL